MSDTATATTAATSPAATNPDREGGATDPATPEQALERTRTVLGWLLDGLPPSAAVDQVQQEWAVGLRMAQLYVQRARQMIVEEGSDEEEIYYRRLAQQQRDRLIFVLFRALKGVDQMEPDRIRSLASIITAGTKLLESRDRVVLQEKKEGQREHRREQSAQAGQLLREAEAFLAQDKANQAAWAKKGSPTGCPPPPKLIRELDPGEPVFDRNRPFDDSQLTAKQRREWEMICAADMNWRCLPWLRPGAFLGNLDQQLAEPPNPASQIAIVPGPGKSNPKASQKTQGKAK
jgi:hypothetical protein